MQKLDARRRAQAAVEIQAQRCVHRVTDPVRAPHLNRKSVCADILHARSVVLALGAALAASVDAAAQRQRDRRPRRVESRHGVGGAQAATRARMQRKVHVQQPVAADVGAIQRQRPRRVARRRGGEEHRETQVLLQHLCEARVDRVRHGIRRRWHAVERRVHRLGAHHGGSMLQIPHHIGAHRSRHQFCRCLGTVAFEKHQMNGVGVGHGQVQNGTGACFRAAKLDNHRGRPERAALHVGVAEHVGALHGNPHLALVLRKRVRFCRGEQARLTPNHRDVRWGFRVVVEEAGAELEARGRRPASL
ncbi:MAG: hypothetical protein CMB08_06875 [Euryarchaeota archaeon]|nr:hypothetical protein [Euryarchaeota archaeon]